MVKTLTRALLGLFLLTSSTVFAQSSNQAEVEELKGFIKNLYENYFSDPNTSISEEDFAQLFDKSFKGTEVEVDVRGEVKIRNTDLGTMMDVYKGFKNSKGNHIRFSVKDFHSVTVKGKTGVASMDLAFELLKDDELISKGEQAVSMTLRRYQETWKITFTNRLFVESEKYVGNCICELLSGNSNGSSSQDGKYASYLTMPDGDEYIETNDRFTISSRGEQRTIVRNGDDHYDWNVKNGNIVKNGEVIGNAKVASTAIKNILKYVNSDRCQRITNKK
jgi:hypothetical protein